MSLNVVYICGSPAFLEKAGKLLDELDVEEKASPYRSAKVDVAVEEADVRKSEAELNIAKTKLKVHADIWNALKLMVGAVPEQTLQSAKAAVLQSEAEVKLAEVNVERAMALLERARSSQRTPSPIAPRAPDAQLQELEDRLAWTRRMHAKGYVTKAQVEQAAAELDKARADHAHANSQKAPLGGANPTLANLEERLDTLQKLHAKGSVSQLEVDRARLALAEARIAVELKTIRDLYQKNPGLK